jgi:hypothetical protein
VYLGLQQHFLFTNLAQYDFFPTPLISYVRKRSKVRDGHIRLMR